MQIQKNNVGIRINILQIPCVPIFRQNWNFDFIGPNLRKNGFWGPNFKKLSPDLQSAPPSSLTGQFSVNIDIFEFFGLNLGKLPNTCDIKVRITLRVLQRAGWRLKWAGLRWMELGGAWNELGGDGWSWVELDARYSNIQF